MAPHNKVVITDLLKRNILFRLYKTYVIDSILIVKEHGFKELLRRKGWKFFLAIFLYYLVRDSILYVLIPLMIARGLLK